MNILRLDPTRTGLIRRKLNTAISTRFNILKRELQELLVKGDAFGLKIKSPIIFNAGEWRYYSDDRKLEELKKWLKFRVGQLFLKHEMHDSAQTWLGAYIQQAYNQGLKRSFTSWKRPTGVVMMDPKAGAIYQQGREAEFMRQSFGGPVPMERARVLATRTFNDLQGLTDDVTTKISRTLLDGLTSGLNPRDIGVELNAIINAGKNRGTTIARTEIVRAFNEGALDGYVNMGATSVGVMVEWSVSGMGTTRLGNPSPCKKCAPLSGLVLTIEEARGLLPRHPNCVTGDTKIYSPDPVAVMRSEYTGVIYELTTAINRKLSVTAHHILLTQRGWVFAKDLTDSDYLVDSPLGEFLPIRPYHNDAYPTISQVFKSFIEMRDESRISKTLTMPHDLHGDGQFCNSEIQVVCTDSPLRGEIKTNSQAKVIEYFLGFGNVPMVKSMSLYSKCSLPSFLKRTASAADRFMCSLGIPSVLLARHSRRPEGIGFGLSSDSNSLNYQSSIDEVPAFSQSFGDFISTAPTEVEFSDMLGNRLTRLIRIESRHVQALPVYDVSTQSTLYIAEGLLTSNCMCSLIPANVGEKSKEQIRDAKRIRSAIAQSAQGDSRWLGAKKKIATRRPSVV